MFRRSAVALSAEAAPAAAVAECGVLNCCLESPLHAKMHLTGPKIIKVRAGEKYYWCSCGLSKKQPWCDGAHKAHNKEHGTLFQPVRYVPEKDGTKLFCMCKHTGTAPFCDFTHVRKYSWLALTQLRLWHAFVVGGGAAGAVYAYQQLTKQVAPPAAAAVATV
jgi:CDGSH-type Zn-finger protein